MYFIITQIGLTDTRQCCCVGCYFFHTVVNTVSILSDFEPWALITQIIRVARITQVRTDCTGLHGLHGFARVCTGLHGFARTARIRTDSHGLHGFARIARVCTDLLTDCTDSTDL